MEEEEIESATTSDIDQLVAQSPSQPPLRRQVAIYKTPVKNLKKTIDSVLKARRKSIIRPIPKELRTIGVATWFQAAVVNHIDDVNVFLRILTEEYGG